VVYVVASRVHCDLALNANLAVRVALANRFDFAVGRDCAAVNIVVRVFFRVAEQSARLARLRRARLNKLAAQLTLLRASVRALLSSGKRCPCGCERQRQAAECSPLHCDTFHVRVPDKVAVAGP
jgi:hypothetical protein